MKITDKQLKILAGLCFLAGAIVLISTKETDGDSIGSTNNYGKWISIAIMIIGLVLLMPWVKKKEE